MKSKIISTVLAGIILAGGSSVAFAQNNDTFTNNTNTIEETENKLPRAALGSNQKFSTATGSGKDFGNFNVKYRTGSTLQVAQSPASSNGYVKTEFRYKKINSSFVGAVQKLNGTVNGVPTNVVMLDPATYTVEVRNLGDTLKSTSNFWFHINS